MVASSSSSILRGPGRVVVNPTTAFATTDYPYGGTEIGKVKSCALHSFGEPFVIESESLAEPSDILEPNRHFTFACFLRGWDDNAIDLLLEAQDEVGSVSAHTGLHEPGSPGRLAASSAYMPGTSSLGRAVILAYVPDDILKVPGLLIYRGVANLGAEPLMFQRTQELGLALTVTCFRDTNDNLLRVGRMADLSLT